MATPAHEGMTHGARRAVIVLFVIMFVIGGANLLFTTGQVHHLAGVVAKQDAQARTQATTIALLRRQQLAACGFAALLGGLPLADSPRPGRTGVVLVGDSRDWWRKNGCPGALAPGAGFEKWAAYYRLPADLRR